MGVLKKIIILKGFLFFFFLWFLFGWLCFQLFLWYFLAFSIYLVKEEGSNIQNDRKYLQIDATPWDFIHTRAFL